MLNQTFSIDDLPRLAILIFLEWLLSMDNAVLLSLIARRLPETLRKKALFIGLFSSIILRAIAIFFVVYLIQFIWIQLIGAAYLIYLSIRYFLKKTKETTYKTPTSSQFWKTVIWIELTDLIFALDSILAAVAFIKSSLAFNIESKLWMIYLGALAGLIGVRFAARGFTHLLNRFTRLPSTSHILVGWIGLHLAITSFIQLRWIADWHLFYEITFWSGIILLLAIGFSKKTEVRS